MSDFLVHDLPLTDSPIFYFSMDTCTNGEVYNMAIRVRMRMVWMVLIFGAIVSRFVMYA